MYLSLRIVVLAAFITIFFGQQYYGCRLRKRNIIQLFGGIGLAFADDDRHSVSRTMLPFIEESPEARQIGTVSFYSPQFFFHRGRKSFCNFLLDLL